MSVQNSDIKFYHSQTKRLGGNINLLNAVTPNQLHELVDKIQAVEAVNGNTDYACFYVRNNSATDTLKGAVIAVKLQPAGGNVVINLGAGTSAINGSEPVVANDGIAPAGVSFASTATSNAGIVLGDLPPLGHKAVWIKRVTAQNTPSASNVPFILNVLGETV